MKVGLWLGACALLIAACPLVAGDKGQDDKFDPAKLDGSWKFVSAIKNGEKIAEDSLKKQTMTMTKDTLTLKSPDATFVMKYTLDTKAKPVGVQFTITEGPVGVGSKADGIIELKGDDLKICYAPEGGDAPKTFEAKEGSKFHLFVLKRSK
jgi:uncharacterized protein (TIGR03067 family)